MNESVMDDVFKLSSLEVHKHCSNVAIFFFRHLGRLLHKGTLFGVACHSYRGPRKDENRFHFLKQGANTLLGALDIATRSKDATNGAPGHTTRKRRY